MTDCSRKRIKTMRPKKKEVSYAPSLCQEKGHTGNPIVSKSSFVKAQMQLLGTETRRNRMREGCRSHYPAWWRSQEKEAEKWQESSSHDLRLGRSMEMEGTAVPILSLIPIFIFLLSCFLSKGSAALLLCYMVEHVLYPFFYRIVSFHNKNDARPSFLSLPSSPPPTPPVFPLWLCVHRCAHTFCEGPQVSLALPQTFLARSSSQSSPAVWWVDPRKKQPLHKSCFLQAHFTDAWQRPSGIAWLPIHNR